MFEITRREPLHRNSIRDLMSFITNDDLFDFPSADANQALALDISEKDGEIVVRASLPGFTKEDVDIQMHNGSLTIKAQREEEHETKDEKFYRRERRVGSYSRTISLPTGVDASKAKADLKDGVLTLRIPQAEEARPRAIKVN